MKILPRDAEAFLLAPDKRAQAALLYGPDSGLVRERARRMKTAVLSADDPFAFVEMPEAVLLDDTARLSDELSAMGFLSAKRLVMVVGAGDKLTAIIRDAAHALHENVFLLVTAGELSTRSPLRDWFEKAPQAAAIACYRDEARDIQAIINRCFSEERITAGRDVVDYLCASLGNDREVTRSELEKIVTYTGRGNALSLEEAGALVDYSRDTQLDDIVMAAADKNISTLDAMLTVHLREGTAPIAYLRALTRYFNRLYFIKSQATAGYDIETVIANLKPKVFYKHVPLITRHARNWGLEQIIRALKLLISAELSCKTTDIPVIAASSRRLMQMTQIR